MTIDTESCYDKAPDNYYLDVLTKKYKRCHSSCFNCLGPANKDTMNCVNCLSDEYFFRKDIKNCTKENEFKKRENLSFEMSKNYNYFIFITIILLYLLRYSSPVFFELLINIF